MEWNKPDETPRGATHPEPRGRRRFGSLLWIVTTLAFLAGCAGLKQVFTRADAGPEGIRFPHAFHISTQQLDCKDCHTLGADKALYNLPTHAVCLSCHNVTNQAKPDATCLKCHVAMPEPYTAAIEEKASQAVSRYLIERYQAGPVNFDHNAHKTQDCDTCHAGIKKSSRASQSHLPQMAFCMSCHNSVTAPSECQVCHPSMPVPYDRPEQLARLAFPHPVGWERTHGNMARQTGEDCQLCHEQQTCENCHQTRPPEDHAGISWNNSLHGRKALMDRERCAACHTQVTCERCHSVAPPSHTPGFLNPLDPFANSEGIRRHSLMGKAELRACLTCHEFQNDCSVCHLERRQ